MKVNFVAQNNYVQFCKKQNGKPYTFRYDEYNNLQSMKYTRPIKLSQALYDLSAPARPTLNEKISGVVSSQRIMRRFLNDLSGNPILNTKVVEIAGRGSVAVAFLTEDGKVLKLTDGNHFIGNRPIEDFDAPIYEKGKAGKTYYYLEEYCPNHGLSPEFVEIISEKIKEKGYRVYDMDKWDTHQIGLSKDGKLYLVDHECARYKSIFHTLLHKFLKI